MEKTKNNNLRRDLRTFIINWNKKWPIDFWWRKKYNVPFGSEKHRQADFIQMYLDYEEDKMMRKIYESKIESPKDSRFEEQFKKSGVGEGMTQDQIDDDFENIDLSSYNTVKES